MEKNACEVIFDFRLPIYDLLVCAAFKYKRPTPPEFHPSAIKNRPSAIFSQPIHFASLYNPFR
jgi:hypothetical protein